ncbi:MAG: ASCH domain-containing protein [Treponema sp.]
MKVLLSFRPEYVTKILDGNKVYEFRKAIFKEQNIEKIIIYATQPVGKVVGEFEIDSILQSAPHLIWAMTKNGAGISEEYFTRYFRGTHTAFAIKIKNPVEYQNPIELEKIIPSGVAPQSFCYLE